ncbi:MAG TPA: hypothetical protein VHX49_05045 [Candidatus Acidoferrales bacterium]|nr:hypothetical protein [Candidatus Acidoferrales bacterium]
MAPSTNASAGRRALLDCTDNLRKRTFRRLLGIMNLVTINCESALLSSDLEQIECHLRNAKKHYLTMLRHFWRLSLTVQDLQALELRSVRLEAVISELEARYATENAFDEPPL